MKELHVSLLYLFFLSSSCVIQSGRLNQGICTNYKFFLKLIANKILTTKKFWWSEEENSDEKENSDKQENSHEEENSHEQENSDEEETSEEEEIFDLEVLLYTSHGLGISWTAGSVGWVVQTAGTAGLFFGAKTREVLAVKCFLSYKYIHPTFSKLLVAIESQTFSKVIHYESIKIIKL